MRPDLIGPYEEKIPQRYLEIIKGDVRKLLGQGDDRTILLVLNEIDNRREKR